MATRIISAVVGIAIAIVILIFSETFIFPLAISLISLLILYELFKAEKCVEYVFTTTICGIFAAVMPFITCYSSALKYRSAFAFAVILLIFISFLAQHKTLSFDKLCFMITVSVLVSLSMCCIVALRNIEDGHGVYYVIFALAAAWLSDSGAYFVGTFFGKHKLAPEISPKKTIEGAIGGVVCDGLLLVLFTLSYVKVMETKGVICDPNYILIFFVGMGSAVLAMIGDLSASLIKRQCQIKDYGSIMPGHGGALDRFDSVLFVAPYIYALLTFIDIIK